MKKSKKGKDSVYVIVGVILFVVAIFLDFFIWKDGSMFFAAIVSSCISVGFIDFAIKYSNDLTSSSPMLRSLPKTDYSEGFVFGVGLINFAVIVIATCILGKIFGYIMGLVVWWIMNIEKSERSEYFDSTFWLFIGFIMYTISWVPGFISFTLKI